MYSGGLGPNIRGGLAPTMNNSPEPDELAPHQLKELLCCAENAWERAPRDALNASFQWKGRGYIASYGSFRLQVHTISGIRILY